MNDTIEKKLILEINKKIQTLGDFIIFNDSTEGVDIRLLKEYKINIINGINALQLIINKLEYEIVESIENNKEIDLIDKIIELEI